MEVKPVFEVAESFMEPPSFHAVSYSAKFFILSIESGNDGSSVHFELGLVLMVVVVAFDFCIGSRVFEGMGCCSHSIIWPSLGLEELLEPLWHGGGWVL